MNEPVKEPGFPRGAFLAVDTVLDFLARLLAVVGPARLQVAQKTFLAVGIATWSHRRIFPIEPIRIELD